MSASKIEWTDAAWNPVTGCTKVSPGCKNCYAERMALRLRAMGQPKYAAGFALTLHPEALDAPRQWAKPRRIFVNSMSDLFHPAVPDVYIGAVFAVMSAVDRHTYQVLTKRPERAAVLSPALPWPPQIWLGASVESAGYTPRIDRLRATGAAVKFLSLEPLLGPLPALNLDGIQWVIVGGESGPGARPMDPAWAREIRDQCRDAGVAFFLKQLGGRRGHGGRELDGETYEEMPYGYGGAGQILSRDGTGVRAARAEMGA